MAARPCRLLTGNAHSARRYDDNGNGKQLAPAPHVVRTQSELRAVHRSGDSGDVVADEQRLARAGQIGNRVAREDGLLLCPEGAATALAWRQSVDRGLVDDADRVVLFNCATGLKYKLPPANAAIDHHEAIDYSALSNR